MSGQLDRLFAEYSLLDSSERGGDEGVRRSLRYFRVERCLIDDPHALDRVSDRTTAWVRMVRTVHGFTVHHGRLPKSYGRSRQVREKAEESRLAEWLRYQRRPGVQARLSDYQVRRLECVEGYSWDPAGERWDDHLFTYLAFVKAHERKPRYRSDDREEQRLAGWAAKQRHLLKRGLLSHAKAMEFQRAISL